MSAPEGLAGGLVQRYRLHRLILGRFDRPLTVLVAGSGYGKSTLLRQVLSASRGDFGRVDVSRALQPGDRYFSEFSSAIRMLLGVESSVAADPAAEAALLAAAIGARAPTEICLTLDDLDRLDHGPGVELVAALLAVLPDNGHLVLTSHEMPDLPVSRYVATGRAIVVGEKELAFTVDEWQVFARSRGVDDSMAPVLWPALARLVAEGSPRLLLRSHLMHEIVRHLSPPDREVLGAVVAIGHADDDIVSAVLGRRVRLADRMATVALVDQTTAGDWVAHSLWHDVLDDVLPTDRQEAIRSAAATVLARRGLFAAAMELAVSDGNWQLAQDVAAAALADQPPAVAMDVLASWQKSVPEAERCRPVWRLVDALVFYEHSLPSARGRLEEIADDLADSSAAPAPGQSGLHVAVLFHLGTIGRRTADEGVLYDVARRLEPIAARGDPRGRAVLVSVLGFLDQIHGRTKAGLARFDAVDIGAVSPEQAAHLLMMEGNLLLLDAQVERATDCYARASELGSSAVRLLARELWATASWVGGRFDEAMSAERECLDAARRMGLDGRAAQFRAMLAVQQAMRGRYADATETLGATHRREGSRSADTETRALTLLAVGLLALAEGDVAGAQVVLRQIPPLDGNLQRALVLTVATLSTILPERRSELASMRAPLVTRALEQSDWLAAGAAGEGDPQAPRLAALVPLVLRERPGRFGAEIAVLADTVAGAGNNLDGSPISDASTATPAFEPVVRFSDADLVALRITRRQLQVLLAVTTGATNAEIARQLHISAETVKKHLDHAYGRLNVNGRAQATALITELIAQGPAQSGVRGRVDGGRDSREPGQRIR